MGCAWNGFGFTVRRICEHRRVAPLVRAICLLVVRYAGVGRISLRVNSRRKEHAVQLHSKIEARKWAGLDVERILADLNADFCRSGVSEINRLGSCLG